MNFTFLLSYLELYYMYIHEYRSINIHNAIKGRWIVHKKINPDLEEEKYTHGKD